MIRELLKGYKTYAIGILMIGVGIYTTDNVLVLQGLGLITLRAGIGTPKQIK